MLDKVQGRFKDGLRTVLNRPFLYYHHFAVALIEVPAVEGKSNVFFSDVCSSRKYFARYLKSYSRCFFVVTLFHYYNSSSFMLLLSAVFLPPLPQ